MLWRDEFLWNIFKLVDGHNHLAITCQPSKFFVFFAPKVG